MKELKLAFLHVAPQARELVIPDLLSFVNRELRLANGTLCSRLPVDSLCMPRTERIG